MKKPLSQEERQQLSSYFSTSNANTLLRACQVAFVHRSGMLEGLKVDGEDIFCEVVSLLDYLMKRTSELSQNDVDELFTAMLHRVRDWQDSTPNDRKAVADSVFRIVRKILCHHWDTYYSDRLYDCFTNTLHRYGIIDNEDDVNRFNDHLSEYSKELDEWVNNQYDGNLSNEFDKAIQENRLFFAVVSNPQKAGLIISTLHQLMEGKTKPKDVMMPIRAAIDAGVIRRPTVVEFRNEFGEDRVKGDSSITDYTDKRKEPYNGEDFESMKSIFSRFKNEK